MTPFFNEKDLTVFILTSELGGKHYGMVATWICPASLRTDELRFTLPLSKFNDSAKAILSTKKFILHKLSKSDFNLAFKMGSSHSNDVDKFQGEDFDIHSSGLRILKSSISHGVAEVLGSIEVEDRHILYCSLKEIKNKPTSELALSQADLFSQLTEEKRSILGAKYISDSKRDTPSK